MMDILKERKCFLCEEDTIDFRYINDIKMRMYCHKSCWKEAGGGRRKNFKTAEEWNDYVGKNFGICENYQAISFDGTKRWFKNGKLHRDNDKPAVIWSDGEKNWHKDGPLHRDGDKPAVIQANGAKVWYKNGKCHRDNDKPAGVFHDGAKYWYKNGKLHRDNDKPAVIFHDGVARWYKNGKQYTPKKK